MYHVIRKESKFSADQHAISQGSESSKMKLPGSKCSWKSEEVLVAHQDRLHKRATMWWLRQRLWRLKSLLVVTAKGHQMVFGGSGERCAHSPKLVTTCDNHFPKKVQPGERIGSSDSSHVWSIVISGPISGKPGHDRMIGGRDCQTTGHP